MANKKKLKKRLARLREAAMQNQEVLRRQQDRINTMSSASYVARKDAETRQEQAQSMVARTLLDLRALVGRDILVTEGGAFLGFCDNLSVTSTAEMAKFVKKGTVWCPEEVGEITVRNRMVADLVFEIEATYQQQPDSLEDTHGSQKGQPE
jgi:hypothetical protein